MHWSRSETVWMKAKALREVYHDKKIIVGRDKLDQIKGVYPKLLAFEKFLDLFPEWRNQVVLIQVTASPPHTFSDPSTKLEAKVSEVVSHINGKYGNIAFAPVHHIHRCIDRDEFYALLTVADVGLITSVRDGMNTTAHEFVVCQQDEQQSKMAPLILSEFTGSAGSFSSALLVNPWDSLGVAQAIHEALCMSKEEKRNRHCQMWNHVRLHTAHHWATTFVNALSGSSKLPTSSHTTPLLDQTLCLHAYQQAKSRLIMLDYDGTLTPIVKHPQAAYPTSLLLTTLQRLCQDPKNKVFVISGRDQATLETWLGSIRQLGLSAEHGCFLKYPNTGVWTNVSSDLDLSWKNDVIDIFSYYAERTQGSFIEHKRCSLTWHYRLADPSYGDFQAKECHNHLENAVLSKFPIEILVGKKNLEVRPFAINKGEIVKRLLTTLESGSNLSSTSTFSSSSSSSSPSSSSSSSLNLLNHFDFVFCIGDDKTDEDMFKVLNKDEDPRNWSVTIGQANKKTTAAWHLLSPQHLISVIQGWLDK
ncbi:threalose-6-phosphate phosphatase [Coelomomyces lativittatus]|nr:threalose-6-phosphate phosphatase [Coelomomyces lativittatus]